MTGLTLLAGIAMLAVGVLCGSASAFTFVARGLARAERDGELRPGEAMKIARMIAGEEK